MTLPEPYYQDDHARADGRFTSESQKGVPKSEAHKRALSAAAKEVWRTKRKPKPTGSTHMHNGYVMEKQADGKWRQQHIATVEKRLGRVLQRSTGRTHG